MSDKSTRAEIKLLRETIWKLADICHQAYREGQEDADGRGSPYRSTPRYTDQLAELLKVAPDERPPPHLPKPPPLRCPHCGGTAKFKDGRYGQFIACDNYRVCKTTRSRWDPRDGGDFDEDLGGWQPEIHYWS